MQRSGKVRRCMKNTLDHEMLCRSHLVRTNGTMAKGIGGFGFPPPPELRFIRLGIICLKWTYFILSQHISRQRFFPHKLAFYCLKKVEDKIVAEEYK